WRIDPQIAILQRRIEAIGQRVVKADNALGREVVVAIFERARSRTGHAIVHAIDTEAGANRHGHARAEATFVKEIQHSAELVELPAVRGALNRDIVRAIAALELDTPMVPTIADAREDRPAGIKID